MISNRESSWFNIDNDNFKDNNEEEFPIQIKFSKNSSGNPHKFLCNDGEDDCSGDLGTVVYLKHLQFKEPLHVYDDTSIPFSGKVFIQDTSHPGSDGCPIANAKIELIQEKKILSSTQNETLVSGYTKPDGSYELPVIIGSTVDYVKIDYHKHEFLPSPKGNFIMHRNIRDGESYLNNDFIDTVHDKRHN